MPQSETYKERLHSLEGKLGYTFKNLQLLELALRHSSFNSKTGPQGSNERLEFLGDSVFNMLVATYLYDKFPTADE